MLNNDITVRELVTEYFAVQNLTDKTKTTYQRAIEIYGSELLDTALIEVTTVILTDKVNEHRKNNPNGQGKHSLLLFLKVIRALFTFYMKSNPGIVLENPTAPLFKDTEISPKRNVLKTKSQQKKESHEAFLNREIEPKRLSTGDITLGELLAVYLKVKTLKEKTRSTYYRLIEINAPDLLEQNVSQITTEIVIAKSDEFSRIHPTEKKRYSFSLFARVMRALYLFYMKRYPGKLTINPVVPLLEHDARPQKRQSRLMKEHVKKWWNSVNALENDKAKDHLKFLLLTGLPKAMSTHLTWSQYEPEQGTLRLESGHIIPLSNYVMKMLNERRTANPTSIAIFSTSDADKLSEYDKSYQLVNADTGYQITPQALGRTFRAFALSNNITESIVLSLMNRTNANASAYGIVYDIDDVRKQTQQITDYILEAAGEITQSSAHLPEKKSSYHFEGKKFVDPKSIDLEALSNVLASVIAKGGDKGTVAVIALSEISLELTNGKNTTTKLPEYRLNIAIPKDYFNKILDTIEQKEATILNAMNVIFGSEQQHQITRTKITTQLVATEGWRKRAIEWVLDSKTNNQGKVRSDNLAAITCDGLLFRSLPEVNLYRALKGMGILFAPLPVFIKGGKSYQRIEPDFVLIKDGIVLHVEVDGDSFHHESPTQAHDRAALIVREGAFIERVSASKCETLEQAKDCAAVLIALLEKYKRSH